MTATGEQSARHSSRPAQGVGNVASTQTPSFPRTRESSAGKGCHPQVAREAVFPEQTVASPGGGLATRAIRSSQDRRGPSVIRGRVYVDPVSLHGRDDGVSWSPSQ